jgi:hypothetical protein
LAAGRSVLCPHILSRRDRVPSQREGVFGGFIAFGFLGLFIGPTLIAIMFTLLRAWRATVAGHPAAANISGHPTW